MGESGQIGNNSTLNALAPVQVGSGFTTISAGRSSSFAIKTDGTLWAWGSNSSSQLGTGTTKSSEPLPVLVGEGYSQLSAGGITGVPGIAIGNGTHTLALKTDGTLWAWGQNAYGQLGDGTTTVRSTPVQVGTGFARISAGGLHSLATKADGTLYAWGSNTMAQTGQGTVTANTLNADQHTPQAVALSNVVSGGISGQGSLSSLTLNSQLRPVAPSLGQTRHAFVVAAVPGGALFAFSGTTWVPFDTANPAAWKAVTSCLSTVCSTIQTAVLFSALDATALRGTTFFVGSA